MYYGTSSGARLVGYGKMACHTICVSARVVNDKNFVKNLLNKKIIKISPKLTISEIIDEAVGDAEVDDPTDYALTNGNFSAKLYTTENSEPFSIENDEPLNTALEFNPSIKYLNFTVNIDTNNNDTVKLPSEFDSKTKDAYSLMMNTRGNEQRATLIDTENATRFTQKEKLYNKVCEHLTANKCFFPNSMAKDDVKKNVFILLNCLWYLDGNYQKIVERSSHDVGKSPNLFIYSTNMICLRDVT
jgi:hypothetical protein